MRILPLLAVGLMLAGCHRQDRSAPEHLAKAERFFAERALTPARLEVEAALGSDPRNPQLRFLAGRIAAAMGDPRGAYAAYMQAGMLDPGDRRAPVAVIELLLDAGEAGAALSRVNASLADDPRNTDALALRALLEQQRGEPAKARRDAQTVLVTAPRQPVAHAVLAALAMADGAVDQARDELDRGLAADPANRWLLQIAAVQAARRSAFGEAAVIDRRIVDAHPEYPGLRARIADLEALAGRTAQAEATLRAAVAVAPRSVPLRLALARYLGRAGRIDAADEVFRQAVLAFADESAVDIAFAADLAGRGGRDLARATLQNVVDRLGDGLARQNARLAQARMAIEDGDLRGARTRLDALIQTSPDDDAALTLRAEIMRPDEADKAVADLLAVSARRPDDPRTYDLLATAYQRRGRTDEALAAQRRAADLRPDDLAAAGRFVDRALALGRPGEARSVLDALVARSPVSLPVRAALIQFLIGQKDWHAADAGLDALKTLPGSADLQADLTGAMMLAQDRPGEAADLFAAQLAKASAPEARLTWAAAYAHAALAAHRGAEALVRLQMLQQDLPAPQRMSLSLVMASVQMGLNQGSDAVASDDSAIRAAPTDMRGYLHKASDLAALRQQDAAIAALDAGIAAGASAAPLLRAKAALLIGDGATDKAVETYEAALAIAPGDVVASNNLVSLLADRKPIDVAQLTTARDALRRSAASGEPRLLDSLAWADYRLGALDDARDLLARAGAEASPSPDLRFHYGAVLIASGEKARGQRLIRSVLDQSFAGKSEAEALLTN